MATLRGLNCCAVFFTADSLKPFSEICPVYKNDRLNISFIILIIISGLFSKSDTVTDSDFQQGHKYDVLIQLKHVLSGLCIDVSNFSFSTNDIENDYINFNHMINLPNLNLPCGVGEYSICIYIKEQKDSSWFLQNEQHFLVTNDL